MTEMDKDFDLLAGHDLAESRVITYKDEEDPDKLNVLVWHKLETVGFQPSAREGHTAVTNGLSVLVFGGFEGGQRVNALISLDVSTCSWSVVPTKGELPPPRSYHAANRYQNLMIVHGGEGKEAFQNPHNRVSFPSQPGGIHEALGSIAEESNPTQIGIASQSTSVLLNEHDNSRELGRRPESSPSFAGKGVGSHDGVTLGDTLGTKLSHQVKVSRATQNEIMGLGSSSSGGIAFNAAANKNPTTTSTTANTTNTTTNTNTLPLPTQTQICCLDDVHVLDTISMEWYKMKCILSPLPRKGHTLNIVPLQGVESAVIFGGYSIENTTVSNSLHVCEADAIYQHYIAKRDLRYKTSTQQNPSNANHVGVIKSLKQDTIEPLMWRTLHTTGTPPSARYRHSSTFIQADKDTPLLVIMGGIGKDASVPLNDVYILDLNTLAWIAPSTGSDALSQGTGGDGPVSGLYGHVAFSVSAMHDPAFEPTTSPGRNTAENELLVFGGSSNPTSGQTNINQNIYAYSMTTHTWRIVPTGFSFPSARSNHTATLVQGWAPVHDIAGASVSNDGLSVRVSQQANRKHKVGSTLRSTATTGNTANGLATAANTTNNTLNTTNNHTSSNGGVCAVIFGGLDSIQCASDTWALDLQWRKAGVEQYDHNVQKQETFALQQPHVTSSHLEQLYLSTPGLTTSEMNASMKNLLDSQQVQQGMLANESSRSLAKLNTIPNAPHASPLQQFGHISLDMGFDTSLGGAHPNSDRNKKQSLNSRKYADIAQALPAFNASQLGQTKESNLLKTKQKLRSLGRSASQGDMAMSPRTSEAMELERERSQSFNDTQLAPSVSNKSNFNNTEFTNYAISSRDYTLPGSKDEQLEIGSAFLKVRKERAQTELALQRERDKLATAENTIIDQAAAILSLQQAIEAQNTKYTTDTEALQEKLRLSEEREHALQELNEEAYLLLTLYGVKKV